MSLTTLFEWLQFELRSTDLLDLPNELLIKIASFVDHEDIPALRRVCHRLNLVASPFLIHTISVKQSQESLDHVQRILEKPHIASGVRGIRVNLGHRFHALVQDKSLFTQVLERQILNHYWLRQDRLPSESDSEYNRRTLQTRRNTYMCEFFKCEYGSRWPNMRVDKTKPNDAKEKYDQLLLLAYERYKKEYHEVTRIASEGSLVRALVKLASFARRPVALTFGRIDGWYAHLVAPGPGPETTFLDYMAETPRLYSVPTDYRKSVEDDMALLDGVIWDLPIALHKAGCIIHAFVLRDVLKLQGDTVLFADALSSSSDKMNQLRQALQNLTEFGITRMMHMKMYHDSNHGTEPPAKRLMFEDLLRTCLSGPGLQSIRLRGDELSDWAKWEDTSSQETWRSERTPVETNINVAHLKDMSVSCVPMILSDGKELKKDWTYVWDEGQLSRSGHHWDNVRGGEWFL